MNPPMKFILFLALCIGAHAAPVRCSFDRGVALGRDTNRLSDVATVWAKQRAGRKLIVEFKDRVDGPWTWLVAFEPCPTARIAKATWTHPDDQRPRGRFFRARETRPVVFGQVRGAAGTFKLNPEFYGLQASSTRE